MGQMMELLAQGYLAKAKEMESMAQRAPSPKACALYRDAAKSYYDAYYKLLDANQFQNQALITEGLAKREWKPPKDTRVPKDLNVQEGD